MSYFWANFYKILHGTSGDYVSRENGRGNHKGAKGYEASQPDQRIGPLGPFWTFWNNCYTEIMFEKFSELTTMMFLLPY